MLFERGASLIEGICLFAAVVFDWLDLWIRWQFYFNKKNFKRNFARDAVKWDKKLGEYKC